MLKRKFLLIKRSDCLRRLFAFFTSFLKDFLLSVGLFGRLWIRKEEFILCNFGEYLLDIIRGFQGDFLRNTRARRISALSPVC